MSLPFSSKSLCCALFLAGCAATTSVADESPKVSPEIRRLLPDEFWLPDPEDRMKLGGSAVGSSGSPSAFFSAAVEAMDYGGASESEYMEMSWHPHLCVRTVGAAGLAKIGSPAGIVRLRALLASRESEHGMPCGCIPARIRESGIAWHFLTGTGYLCCRRQTPLLAEKENSGSSLRRSFAKSSTR